MTSAGLTPSFALDPIVPLNFGAFFKKSCTVGKGHFHPWPACGGLHLQGQSPPACRPESREPSATQAAPAGPGSTGLLLRVTQAFLHSRGPRHLLRTPSPPADPVTSHLLARVGLSVLLQVSWAGTAHPLCPRPLSSKKTLRSRHVSFPNLALIRAHRQGSPPCSRPRSGSAVHSGRKGKSWGSQQGPQDAPPRPTAATSELTTGAVLGARAGSQGQTEFRRLACQLLGGLLEEVGGRAAPRRLQEGRRAPDASGAPLVLPAPSPAARPADPAPLPPFTVPLPGSPGPLPPALAEPRRKSGALGGSGGGGARRRKELGFRLPGLFGD